MFLNQSADTVIKYPKNLVQDIGILLNWWIFTGPIQSPSSNISELSVSVCVCAIAENPLPSGLETSGQSV